MCPSVMRVGYLLAYAAVALGDIGIAEIGWSWG
jgi:hypothetical protein